MVTPGTTPSSYLTASKLGYWIVEPLVEDGEYYPKGGMRRLVRSLFVSL